MNAEDINQLFAACDRKSKGFLNRDELSNLCSDLNLGESQLTELFDSLDVNHNGRIEKHEFVEQFSAIALRSADVQTQRWDDEEIGVRTSTPVVDTKPRSKSSWDKFLDGHGHIVFGLPSYEKIRDFHILASDQPNIFNNFQDMIKALLKDVSGFQENINELESSIARVTKQSEDQLMLFEEEMETQIRIQEQKVREEEKENYEKESSTEREKYEKQIAQLQEAVYKLKQVDEKLSGVSSYNNEMEKLREKLREVTTDNSSLRMRLNEADTNIVILQSKITSQTAELHEVSVEHARQLDAATSALSEREDMLRQANSLYLDNRRLQDSNDTIRAALDTNIAAFRRISKSPSASYNGDFLNNSSNYFERSSMIGGISPRSSVLDMQALAECDPRLKTEPFSADDDDTEPSLDGSNTLRTSSNFEPDSGFGTIRGEYDSESEIVTRYSVRMRPRLTNSFYPPQSSKRSSRRYRSKEERTPSRQEPPDIDLSDDIDAISITEEQPKSRKKRKIVNPDVNMTKGPLFKVILCGDASVGKSSFILRFCEDQFHVNTRSTLGLDFRIKNVHLGPNEVVTVQLWDTAGQERFRSIATSYFRKADGVILLYDITCPSSFINVRDWMERISETVPGGTPVLICGNKIDLRSENDGEKCVYPKEGAQLAANVEKCLRKVLYNSVDTEAYGENPLKFKALVWKLNKRSTT